MKRSVTDPVCGMAVRPNQHALTFRAMHFAFCSEQCRERFLRHPGLYVGHPGWRPVKVQGRAVNKRRRIRLERALSSQQAATVRARLEAMMGVRDVLIRGAEVEIAYDLLQVTEEQIEAQLGAAGAQLGHGWPERLRRAFVHYEEEMESENLGAPPFRHP